VLSVYGVYCVSMCASHDRISISVAPLSEVKTTSEEKTVKMRWIVSCGWKFISGTLGGGVGGW
jgi:hypothetical protein